MISHPVPYIDIHTHRHPDDPEVFALVNRVAGKDLPCSGPQSLGIHPWYLSAENAEELKEMMLNQASDPCVSAIGECGLDKICRTDMNLQTAVFRFQVDLANELEKPLMIHCVKAFQEIFQVLKAAGNRVPVIFHGFNKNRLLAHDLIEKGHYLSFGQGLLHERTRQVFAGCPPHRVFLETDDAYLSVKDIYAVAARTLHLSAGELQTRIHRNYQQLFHKSGTF